MAGLGGDQVVGEQQDAAGDGGDGGEPGGGVEEAVYGVDVEDLGGGPAAVLAQRAATEQPPLGNLGPAPYPQIPGAAGSVSRGWRAAAGHPPDPGVMV